MTQNSLKDFVIIKRKLYHDYLNGKINSNELIVLLWIFLTANPYNGFFVANYDDLTPLKKFKKEHARRILSDLKKKHCVFFLNHRGRAGKFQVYPVDLLRTNGKVQTWEYLTGMKNNQTNSQPSNEPSHNLECEIHNSDSGKTSSSKKLPDIDLNTIFTPAYNDNENDNNNDNIVVNKKNNSSNYVPSTYEEQRCFEIARELGEADMRFILSCLRDYGFPHIERAWGLFKEKPSDEINDPRKYFNGLIRGLAEQNS